jgi:hypothetical protein
MWPASTSCAGAPPARLGLSLARLHAEIYIGSHRGFVQLNPFRSARRLDSTLLQKLELYQSHCADGLPSLAGHRALLLAVLSVWTVVPRVVG